MPKYSILILGATYGLLLASKLLFERSFHPAGRRHSAWFPDEQSQVTGNEPSRAT